MEDLEDKVHRGENVSDSESDGEDWSEAEEEYKDLFGDRTFASARECLEHVKQSHGIDFTNLNVKNEYEWIRTVNFCRRSFAQGQSVASISQGLADRAFLQDDIFLQPLFNEDPLLYSFEDVIPMEQDQEGGDEDLEASEKISMLEEELAKCKAMIRDLIENASDESSDSDNDNQPSGNCTVAVKKAKKKSKRFDDSYYFESYGHLDIHEEMLRDRPRTESYRDALAHALQAMPGATVMDVGCGTGILSLFAARSGASKVIAVEASKIGVLAEKIVRRNGFEKTIRIERERLENLQLAQDEKVDILVSEWMGYGLLFESMLDSVLDARDRYLKPDGIMIPARAAIFVQGQSDDAKAEFWKSVYGFDFSDVRDQFQETEAIVELVKPDSIVTDRPCLIDIDIKSTTKQALDFSSKATLSAERTATMHSVVVSFDCLMVEGFDLVLSTAAESTPTHWVQTVLPLKTPLSLQKGDKVELSLSYKRNEENPREIDITLALSDQLPILYTLK